MSVRFNRAEDIDETLCAMRLVERGRLIVLLVLPLGAVGLSACSQDSSQSDRRADSFCRAYRHVPDDVPIRHQLWAWTKQVAAEDPPSDMPEDAVRGIAVARSVYRAIAHGRAGPRHYDGSAMQAFQAYGDERCGQPSGGYVLQAG